MQVLDRLRLEGGETLMDAGCGTGRLTAVLIDLPEGGLRRRFVDELTEQAVHDDPPYSFDYCRLNIRAIRPFNPTCVS